MTAGVPFGAVIFDCDGVLVASEALVNDIEARLLSRLGLALSPTEARTRFKGHTVAEIVAMVEGLLRERLARAAYVGTVNLADYVECFLHWRGRPTRWKVQRLHEMWFDGGIPVTIDLRSTPNPPDAV